VALLWAWLMLLAKTSYSILVAQQEFAMSISVVIVHPAKKAKCPSVKV
jgi:hypothetical protein